jgi:hypothetical protein
MILERPWVEADYASWELGLHEVAAVKHCTGEIEIQALP